MSLFRQAHMAGSSKMRGGHALINSTLDHILFGYAARWYHGKVGVFDMAISCPTRAAGSQPVPVGTFFILCLPGNNLMLKIWPSVSGGS